MKKGKKVFTFVSSVMLIFVLAVPISVAAPSKPIELKAVTFYRKDHKLVKAFWMLSDRINKRAKGELVIKYVGGPEAINMFQQGAAVQKGVVDIAWVPGSLYAAQVPAARLLTLSMLTPQEEREKGAIDIIRKAHKKAGIFFLGRGYVNSERNQFNLFTNKKVRTPSDLAGQRMGPGTIMRTFQKELGITPVVIKYPELYSALERGAVDGFIQPMSALTGWAWQEVTKYMIDPALFQSNLCTIINLKTWNSLPEHLKSLFREVQLEIERDVPIYDKGFRNSEWQKLKAGGLKIIKFSPDDAKQFLETAYRVEWGGQTKKVDPGVAKQLKELF